MKLKYHQKLSPIFSAATQERTIFIVGLNECKKERKYFFVSNYVQCKIFQIQTERSKFTVFSIATELLRKFMDIHLHYECDKPIILSD